MTDRSTERDESIWLDYAKGASQPALARLHGLSQQRISQILAEQRAALPPREREELIARAVAFLDWAKSEALTLWAMAGAPVTSGKDGDVVHDPETGAVVRDHGGRLAGLKTAVEIERHLAKLLGLDAASKIEATVSGDEALAVAALAEEAAARVAGES